MTASEDGQTAPSHLCIHDAVTEELLSAVGLSRDAVATIVDPWAKVELGRRVPLGGRSGRHIDDPRREGPFLPGTPPPIVLLSDLLAWSEQDLRTLGGLGARSVEKLVTWLAANGYDLAERDSRALRRFRRELGVSYHQTSTSRDVVHVRGQIGPTVHGRFELVGLPEVDIPAGTEAAIELETVTPFTLQSLHIAPAVAFAIAVISLRVDDVEILACGEEGVPGPIFDDLVQELDLGQQPGTTLMLHLVNVSSRPVRFRGAMRVHWAEAEVEATLGPPPGAPHLQTLSSFPELSGLSGLSGLTLPTWLPTPPIVPPGRGRP